MASEQKDRDEDFETWWNQDGWTLGIPEADARAVWCAARARAPGGIVSAAPEQPTAPQGNDIDDASRAVDASPLRLTGKLIAAPGTPVAWVVKGPGGSVYHLSVQDGWTVDPVVFAPQSAALAPERCPVCKYQYGHQIGCENNPVDQALKQAAPQSAEPVAEVHPNHLRPDPNNDGGHFCREVLLYSGNNPHDWKDGKNYRVKLYLHPASAVPQPSPDKDEIMRLLDAAINQVACRSGDDKIRALRAAVEQVVAEREDWEADARTWHAHSDATAERAERAEQENECLRRVLDRVHVRQEGEESALERAEREAAELRKDAERIDFIERNHYEVSVEPSDGEMQWTCFRVTGWPNDREWHTIGRGESLRASIDAAMKEGK